MPIQPFLTRAFFDSDPSYNCVRIEHSITGRFSPLPTSATAVIDLPDGAPSWRKFRGAWVIRDGALTHDMDKCRELHKEKFRRARKPLLEKLDVEYMRADEAGDTAAKDEIAAKKQALRDVTSLPELDAAQTPQELYGIWPEYLR